MKVPKNTGVLHFRNPCGQWWGHFAKMDDFLEGEGIKGKGVPWGRVQGPGLILMPAPLPPYSTINPRLPTPKVSVRPGNCPPTFSIHTHLSSSPLPPPEHTLQYGLSSSTLPPPPPLLLLLPIPHLNNAAPMSQLPAWKGAAVGTTWPGMPQCVFGHGVAESW